MYIELVGWPDRSYECYLHDFPSPLPVTSTFTVRIPHTGDVRTFTVTETDDRRQIIHAMSAAPAAPAAPPD